MTPKPPPPERPAERGELCPCGRQAVTVYLTERHGEVGYCGLPDGGTRVTKCPFCDEEISHWGEGGRCPEYRLRPAVIDAREQPVRRAPVA